VQSSHSASSTRRERAPSGSDRTATGVPETDERAQVIEDFRRYVATGDPALRARLIEGHRWVALHCARRFDGRGEPLDDLVQVALLGVVKAVDRFDPERGTTFSTFAVPTVLGELRRHFRDTTWPMRVPRRLKELSLELTSTVQLLTHELGRAPRVDELADRLRASVEDVLEALEAGATYRLRSINERRREDDDPVEDRVGGDDPDLGRAEASMAVRELLDHLHPREQRIVYLRYFEGLTQAEIAEQVGVSQVHVSRLLRASLERMHERFTGRHRAAAEV
jgi:RNA polymerase sigma-B factor